MPHKMKLELYRKGISENVIKELLPLDRIQVKKKRMLRQ